MTDDRRADDAVRAWLRSGPEAATAEFVERTLRPIPHMRAPRSRASHRIYGLAGQPMAGSPESGIYG